MINLESGGPQEWAGVHVTHRTTVAGLYNVDNVGPHGRLLTGWAMFRWAGEELDRLIGQARDAGTRILPIGSGWALSKINITDGWLINTKLLNSAYDVADKYFDPAYPAERRPYLALAQAGMQIAELNTFLELLPVVHTQRRAIQAAGIGNGQTVAGSVSGNTHGSQLTFGAMPDFVVGLHVATGSGQTVWIERKTKPVVNQQFLDKLGARLIRDDDIFHAAQVSFGTFGIIAAVAVETAPIYQLLFPPIADIRYADLKAKLNRFAAGEIPDGLYHYEFIFDPFTKTQMAMEASAPKVPFEPGVPTPKPRWIIRDKNGFAPGVNILNILGLVSKLLPPGLLTGIEYKSYRQDALLDNVRGTPGQIYTSSIYYLEGYIESAFAVSVKDAAATIDLSSKVSQDLRLPSIYQVRLCKASAGTLAFTQLEPITAVFEVGMIHDQRFPEYERRLDEEFRKAGIRYTMHWSKNSGINPEKLRYMYGEEKIASWKAARRMVFNNDLGLMQLFETDAMVEAGLGAVGNAAASGGM